MPHPPGSLCGACIVNAAYLEILGGCRILLKGRFYVTMVIYRELSLSLDLFTTNGCVCVRCLCMLKMID